MAPTRCISWRTGRARDDHRRHRAVSVRFAERGGDCTRPSSEAVALVVTTYDISEGKPVDRAFTAWFED